MRDVRWLFTKRFPTTLNRMALSRLLSLTSGWTKQKLYNLLHGRNRISVEDYEAICEALSVPFDFFCEDKTNPASSS